MWLKFGSILVASCPIILYEKRVYDLRSVKKPAAFYPGSVEEIMKDSLETGDVILFHRIWYNYHLPYASGLGLYRRFSGGHYDLAGVVVQDRLGEPYLLESSSGGVQLRRFEERMLKTKAREAVCCPIRPRQDLSNDERERMFAIASEYAAARSGNCEGLDLLHGAYHFLVYGSESASSYICPSSSVVVDFLRLLYFDTHSQTSSMANPLKTPQQGSNELPMTHLVVCDSFARSKRSELALSSMGLDYSFGETIDIPTKP